MTIQEKLQPTCLLRRSPSSSLLRLPAQATFVLLGCIANYGERKQLALFTQARDLKRGIFEWKHAPSHTRWSLKYSFHEPRNIEPHLKLPLRQRASPRKKGFSEEENWLDKDFLEGDDGTTNSYVVKTLHTTCVLDLAFRLLCGCMDTLRKEKLLNRVLNTPIH